MKTIEDEFNIGSMKIVSCYKNYFYKFQNSHNDKNEFDCVHSVNMVIMVVTDITENISRNTVQKHVTFLNETSNPFHINFIPKAEKNSPFQIDDNFKKLSLLPHYVYHLSFH